MRETRLTSLDMRLTIALKINANLLTSFKAMPVDFLICLLSKITVTISQLQTQPTEIT